MLAIGANGREAISALALKYENNISELKFNILNRNPNHTNIINLLQGTFP